ncbi:MAG: DUF2062 domain-containing protein [Acidobacteriota bacterium]
MGRARRRLRILLRRALHTGDSPRRTAAAFSLGTFLGVSPFFGLHTALALGLAFLLRLNRLAVLLGTFILNPWTVVPIYGSGTALGLLLLGRSADPADSLARQLQGIAGVGEFVEVVAPLLGPFVLGNVLLAMVAGLVTYPVALAVVHRMRAARRTRRRTTPGGTGAA